MIYKKIKLLCKERGITIYRLEKDLAFSPSTVIKWRTSMPTVDKLNKVADHFGVSIEYFLEGDPAKEVV